MDNNLMTVKEASVFLRMGKSTLYRMVDQRKIPCVRVGQRSVRFKEADLRRWIDKHTVKELRDTIPGE